MATFVVGVILADSAVALTPKVVMPPPGGSVEVVRGQPFSFPVQPFDDETFEVQFSLAGGPVIATDGFPPYGDFIPTRHLMRRGIDTDIHYTLLTSSIQIDESRVGETAYDFVIHPLPVIPRVHLRALIVKGRPHLVGFRLLRMAADNRVKAWGIGFGSRGRFLFPLRLTRSTELAQTYVVRGGRRWRGGSNPHIVVSIAPPVGAERHGVPIRGRIISGLFRTDRGGDTVFRQTDRWRRCTETLSRGERPPRRRSCYFY